MNHNGHRHLLRRYQTAASGHDTPLLSFFGSIQPIFDLRKISGCLLGFFFFFIFSKSIAAANPNNLIYHNATSFKIPFEFDAADKKRIKSIELYVSEDRGETWRLYTSTTTTTNYFAFRGNREGEFWFAVRTLDIAGHYNPSDDKPIVPDWRVVVDTQKPSLGMEVLGRQGTLAAVRWDARDENLNIGSLKIEYSQPGTGIWRPVPIDRLAPSGEAQWDAGSANAIRMRASVEDKAGNIQNFETDLPDGVAQRPPFNASKTESMDAQAPAPIAHMASAGDRRGILGMQNPREIPSRPVSGDWVDNPTSNPGAGTDNSRMSQVYQGQAAADSASRNMGGSAQDVVASHVNLTNSPKFPLNYSVDDAGPNGPASVELWITRDGGKNWSRWAEDTDRVSPFAVDLGGEGFYGLSIVARSLAGQGDEIPRAGSQAQIWIEVDSTPPAIVLNTIKLGVGTQSGKVLIPWRAEDRNFVARPISLFYRPETSNQWVPIAENIENSGQFVWTPGPQVPPVFHVRIEAIDKAGNKSGVDTTSYEPVLFDRSRPRAKIIGLNVNPPVSARSENGASSYRSEERPRAVVSDTLPQPVSAASTPGQNLNAAPPVKQPVVESAKLPEAPQTSDSEPKLPAIDPPVTEKVEKAPEQPKPESTESSTKPEDHQTVAPKTTSTNIQTKQSEADQKQSNISARSTELAVEKVQKSTDSTNNNEINLNALGNLQNSSGLADKKNLAESSNLNVSAELPPLTEIPVVEPITEAPPALGVEKENKE